MAIGRLRKPIGSALGNTLWLLSARCAKNDGVDRLKRRWHRMSRAVVIALACAAGACTERAPEALDGSGASALTEAARVRSLLQLIARPESYDGCGVDLGAYVVLDTVHGVGFLEYGLSVEEGSAHIIDSSPVGFELSSMRCRGAHDDASAVLTAEQIRSGFTKRKAAYAFIRATFEHDSGQFDGGRICDITELRLVPDAG